MSKTNHLQYLETYSSDSTSNSSKYSIRSFLTSIYGKGNLEDLAKRYFQEKRDREIDIQNFFVTIKHRPPNSIRVVLSHVKTLNMENGIEFPQIFLRRLTRRIKGTKARTQDRTPTTEELKQILMPMPLQGMALYLTLVSSGMRIGELLQITSDDINLNENPVRIEIRGQITKSGNRRTAYISNEAKMFIMEWLKIREEYLASSVKRSRYPKDTEEERLFPFSQQNALYIWHNAIKKARLNQRDPSTNRYKLHPHVLRKFFRTRLATVIPVDAVEVLMGHDGYLTGAYRKYTMTDLIENYKKGEAVLTVFSDRHEIDKLKKSLGKQNTQFQQLINGLTGENLNLKSDMEKQKTEVGELKTNLEFLTIHFKNIEQALMKKLGEIDQLHLGQLHDQRTIEILSEQKKKR